MVKKKSHIHFVGIGGIGMSGIATILHSQGHIISGCDTDLDQKSIEQLKKLGCTIYQGNNNQECYCPSITTIVYTTMVTRNSPEIIAAQQRGIPTRSRGEMLGIILEDYISTICIAGSHGKTTTIALIAHILIEALYDPTVIIGGHLKTIDSNVKVGSKHLAVVESDESDRSFLFLKPTIAVITNISLEHLETYTDIEDIKRTFTQFIHTINPDGKAIIGIDDFHLSSLLPIVKSSFYTYGLTDQADLYADQIVQETHKTEFMVYEKNNNTPITHISFPLIGKHNIQNALAAILATLQLKIPIETIAQALHTFKGVERRFIYHGLYKNAEIFDDYGHHPREIAATILAAKHRVKNKLVVIFQPHRYTRLSKLWNQFIETFLSLPIDTLIITDIHAAGEEHIANVSGKIFHESLAHQKPLFSVLFAPLSKNFHEIKQVIDATINQQDLVLLLGAGKINQLVKELVEPAV